MSWKGESGGGRKGGNLFFIKFLFVFAPSEQEFYYRLPVREIKLSFILRFTNDRSDLLYLFYISTRRTKWSLNGDGIHSTKSLD